MGTFYFATSQTENNVGIEMAQGDYANINGLS